MINKVKGLFGYGEQKGPEEKTGPPQGNTGANNTEMPTNQPEGKDSSAVRVDVMPLPSDPKEQKDSKDPKEEKKEEEKGFFGKMKDRVQVIGGKVADVSRCITVGRGRPRCGGKGDGDAGTRQIDANGSG